LVLNASSLTLNTNHGPFTGTLSIVQSSPDSVPIATATLPDGQLRGFPRVTTSAEMRVEEMFSSQSELDAHYRSGTYTFAMATRNNGFQFPELTMPVTVYPTNPPPQVSNFAAAQAIAPESPFTLQWNNPSDAAGSDYVWVLIMDRDGYTVFSTPYPPVNAEASLRGTDTSVEIPANTFHLGETYTGVIVFFRLTGVNTDSYPGAFGLTLAIADTAFPMATISPVPVLSQPTRISNSQFGFLLSGLPGMTYSILVATNPARPLTNWQVLLTTNLSDYSAFIQDNNATNRRRFYSARLEP
jgi:hypothetical protein